MSFKLVYLDHESTRHHWYFSALDQSVAEAIAIAYCNIRGYQFADLERGVGK